jgi:hypothetical protein
MRTSLAAQMWANPRTNEAVGWNAAIRLMNEDEGTYRKIRLTVSAITGHATKWKLVEGWR